MNRYFNKKKDSPPPKITSLTVAKDSEFFIALNTQKQHSFITLGVIDKTSGKPQILSRFGKFDSLKDRLLQNPKIGIAQEPRRPKGKISYAAYAITLEQYNRFLDLISDFHPSGQNFTAFLLEPTDNDALTFSINYISPKNLSSPGAKNIKKSVMTPVYQRSCRKTAIDLLEYTLSEEETSPYALSQNVSRWFFQDLPLKTTFSYGVPQDHFYVFPQPPNSFKGKVDTDKLKTLQLVFLRMEALLNKAPYAPATIKKFDALKSFYLNISGSPVNSPEQLLDAIIGWKQANHQVLTARRKSSFLGRLFKPLTSTERMLHKIEKELEKASDKNHPRQ